VRIVLQRVDRASVDVDGLRIAEIGRGMLLLVGIACGDEALDVVRIARKIVDLRIFEDTHGKMNRAVREVGGEIIVVPQFTLHADTSKGRRPSFVDAAPPEIAEPVFERLVEALGAEGLRVETGRFGAKMAVELVNAGPVTLILELAEPASSG